MTLHQSDSEDFEMFMEESNQEDIITNDGFKEDNGNDPLEETFGVTQMDSRADSR